MAITDTQLHPSSGEGGLLKNARPVPSLWRCIENTYSDTFSVVCLLSPSPFLLHPVLARAYELNGRRQLVQTMAGGTATEAGSSVPVYERVFCRRTGSRTQTESNMPDWIQGHSQRAEGRKEKGPGLDGGPGDADSGALWGALAPLCCPRVAFMPPPFRPSRSSTPRKGH